MNGTLSSSSSEALGIGMEIKFAIAHTMDPVNTKIVISVHVNTTLDFSSVKVLIIFLFNLINLLYFVLLSMPNLYRTLIGIIHNILLYKI